MYLPQFHSIPENDEWWGEGYTEWTALRSAKPLYEGHMQPKVPINQNYYNLLDKQTMQNQAELMKKYGVDGQCFYHYYFKDGRMVLEQPAERLLEWTDIEMPFCFCWANQSWIRTWSSIKGNSWADIFEKKAIHNSQQDNLLLEQKYGKEEEWKRHFEYLLPFFNDKRYIKKNGAPLFLLYEPENIYCLWQMLDYWRMLARENGFPGIYVIGMNLRKKMDGLDAIMPHAPQMFWTRKYDEEKGGIFNVEYSEIWDRIIAMPPKDDCKIYLEGVVNYDDAPRRGKNATIVKNFSFEKLYWGLCQLYRKSFFLDNEYVFINAWNEWGEGMYLEPDEENGYRYLEILKQAQNDVEAEEKDYKFSFDENQNEMDIEAAEQQCSKYMKIANCFERWMLLREENKALTDYLAQYSIKTVAVYGMGMLGRHLLIELEKSSLEIKYIVDRRSDLNNPKYKVVGSYDDFEEVDAFIVTAIGELEDIYNNIKKKTRARIFSLEEIVYER